MSTVTGVQAPKGLEGIVATTSGICYIDGDAGVLAYRGYDIHDLAEHSTFEEVCYLLWFGRLPSAGELRQLQERLAAARTLDPAIIAQLRAVPRHVPPMDALRTLVSALSYYDPDSAKNDHDSNINKAIRLTSQIAILVANYDRVRNNKPLVEPDGSLSHAANFLLMLNGVKPSATAERALDIALILHADHELNASTFAARVVAATLSDMHSAITAAIGALKGPLHGGANEAVFKILMEIDKAHADPVEHIKGMLAQKKKVPGFGHRVYHTEDPRATHLRKMSEDLGKASGQPQWFDYSRKIEQYVRADKKLNANVDFYSASTYHTLGIAVDLFTPIFAVSRVSGWTAHVIEQLDDNRLIRPRADYIGPEYPQHYVGIESR
ncbi:MAG: citrate synthase, partial [Terriglobales bacterium]